jgi:hypothetical protein
MSEITFNIADYRPLGRVRMQDGSAPPRPHTGFVVLSSHSEQNDYGRERFEAKPAVVDIRSVREAHRSFPRRGKILRFSNPSSHRLYTMPSQYANSSRDDDPGPMVA